MKVRLMFSALVLGMIATSANAQEPATKQEPAKAVAQADTGKKMEAMKSDVKKGAVKMGAAKKAAVVKKADTATKKP